MQESLLGKNSTFAERLRWLRSSEQLTLQAFGDAVLYDKSYISRLESGSSLNPSARFLTAVCHRFHVDREWLENGKGDSVSRVAPTLASARFSEERRGLVSALLEGLQAVEAVRILAKHSSVRQMLKASVELTEPGKLLPQNGKLWSAVLTRALVSSPGDDRSLLEKAVVEDGDELEKVLTPEFIVRASRFEVAAHENAEEEMARLEEELKVMQQGVKMAKAIVAARTQLRSSQKQRPAAKPHKPKGSRAAGK